MMSSKHLSLQPEEQHKYIVTPKREKPFHATYYLTDPERKEILDRLNATALALYEYYLRLACKTKSNVALDDHQTAQDLGLNRHTIRRQKSELTKAGWLKVVKLRNSTSGHRGFHYYLGKEAVEFDASPTKSKH